MGNKYHLDKLRKPFQEPETKEQKRLHTQIRELCKQDFVIMMSYPELFDVFDRVKLTFQLDMCKRMGLIKFNKDKLSEVKPNSSHK